MPPPRRGERLAAAASTPDDDAAGAPPRPSIDLLPDDLVLKLEPHLSDVLLPHHLGAVSLLTQGRAACWPNDVRGEGRTYEYRAASR